MGNGPQTHETLSFAIRYLMEICRFTGTPIACYWCFDTLTMPVNAPLLGIHIISYKDVLFEKVLSFGGACF